MTSQYQLWSLPFLFIPIQHFSIRVQLMSRGKVLLILLPNLGTSYHHLLHGLPQELPSWSISSLVPLQSISCTTSRKFFRRPTRWLLIIWKDPTSSQWPRQASLIWPLILSPSFLHHLSSSTPCLAQGLVKPGPLPVFINTVLLEHCLGHSLMYCLHLLSWHNGKLPSSDKRLYGPQSLKYWLAYIGLILIPWAGIITSSELKLYQLFLSSIQSLWEVTWITKMCRSW